MSVAVLVDVLSVVLVVAANFDLVVAVLVAVDGEVVVDDVTSDGIWCLEPKPGSVELASAERMSTEDAGRSGNVAAWVQEKHTPSAWASRGRWINTMSPTGPLLGSLIGGLK